MNRLLASIAGFAILLIILVSCYYDNQEALYPTLSTGCDTTAVTYSGTIQPLIANNCITCHFSAATGGNITLNTYNEVVANSSRITGSIKHLSNYSAMPKNSAKLSDCKIAEWDIWVRKGMLND
jgi:hypothetical protein